MPCLALIRRPRIQRLYLHLKLEEILHSTCRPPVWLVGVELVRSKVRILNLLQDYDYSNYDFLRGCGVDVDRD